MNNAPKTETQTQDFARLVELQELYTSTSNKIATLEASTNTFVNDTLKGQVPDFVVLQETLAKCDQEIRELFKRNPQWKGPNKSVKTPFGEVGERTTTEMDIPNPAMTVALIKGRGASDPAFKSSDFLHVEELPSKEALERLKDDELADLGVRRISTESITVKAAKVNMAKAVKAAKSKGQPVS